MYCIVCGTPLTMDEEDMHGTVCNEHVLDANFGNTGVVDDDYDQDLFPYNEDYAEYEELNFND